VFAISKVGHTVASGGRKLKITKLEVEVNDLMTFSQRFGTWE
jgi:hypothetical protein